MTEVYTDDFEAYDIRGIIKASLPSDEQKYVKI